VKRKQQHRESDRKQTHRSTKKSQQHHQQQQQTHTDTTQKTREFARDKKILTEENDRKE